MENRINEQQLDLFADRTPTATMKANQLWLWFASMASVLHARLRGVALAGTELANATVGTIRFEALVDLRLGKAQRAARASGHGLGMSLSRSHRTRLQHDREARRRPMNELHRKRLRKDCRGTGRTAPRPLVLSGQNNFCRSKIGRENPSNIRTRRCADLAIPVTASRSHPLRPVTLRRVRNSG